MKITAVEYSRLLTHGNYENTKVGLSATVEDGDTPEIVLGHLRQWVAGKLADEIAVPKERVDARQELADLIRERRALEAKVEQARKSWEKSKKILEAHGVPLDWSEDLFKDFPF